MKFNDIIIDIDYIWACFSGQPLHIKPQSAKELGAKVVFIDTDKQTCLNRAEICRSKIWRKFINEWFDINTPLYYH